MIRKIAVLPGDGIGPEVMKESIKVLHAVSKKYSLNLKYCYAEVGGAAFDKTGTALPKATIKTCESSKAILFGSVGGPKWKDLPREKMIEKVALLGLRKHFDFYANLRPAILFDELIESSPLKNARPFDIMIVRELSGDAYFGNKELRREFATDEIKYTKLQCERIAKTAFEIAMKRKKHVTCIDKSNVLSSSIFFRNIISNISKEYKKVKLDCMYVDNASIQLIKNPQYFDVIVTTNMFGDILSDEAAMITGSIGLLPSASLNEKGFGLYEPAGGSAPDIAGKGIANPIAQILSAALMLRYSFNEEIAANDIKDSIRKILAEGYRTKDIMQKGMKEVTTEKMGDLIKSKIR